MDGISLTKSAAISSTGLPMRSAIFVRNASTPSERVGPGRTELSRQFRRQLGQTARDRQLCGLGEAAVDHLLRLVDRRTNELQRYRNRAFGIVHLLGR